MVRASRRGGVPVLRRPTSMPSSRNASPSITAGGSPERQAGYFSSPQWIRPFRNVPVVTTTAPASTVPPRSPNVCCTNSPMASADIRTAYRALLATGGPGTAAAAALKKRGAQRIQNARVYLPPPGAGARSAGPPAPRPHLPRPLEGLITPGAPVDRGGGVLAQVGAGLVNESIGETRGHDGVAPKGLLLSW